MCLVKLYGLVTITGCILDSFKDAGHTGGKDESTDLNDVIKQVLSPLLSSSGTM